MGHLIATYLANRPSGAPEVYLIVAVTVCAVAAGWAAWGRDLWRTLMAFGLGFFALALLSH
jgi:hypothetical protein